MAVSLKLSSSVETRYISLSIVYYKELGEVGLHVDPAGHVGTHQSECEFLKGQEPDKG